MVGNNYGPCELCWTVAWAPIPEKERCALKHPHQGEHVLCEHCELLATYERLVNYVRSYPGILDDKKLHEWETGLAAVLPKHEEEPVEPPIG